VHLLLRGMTVKEGDPDFNILIKLCKYRNHAINAEVSKACISYARKLGVRYAGNSFSLTGRQSAIIKRADYLGGENGPSLFNAGILTAEVAKYIAAAADQFKW
jgi:hypothetical protein